jgi:hypothetical protein
MDTSRTDLVHGSNSRSLRLRARAHSLRAQAFRRRGPSGRALLQWADELDERARELEAAERSDRHERLDRARSTCRPSRGIPWKGESRSVGFGAPAAWADGCARSGAHPPGVERSDTMAGPAPAQSDEAV